MADDGPRSGPVCYFVRTDKVPHEDAVYEYRHWWARILAERSGSWFDDYLDREYIWPYLGRMVDGRFVPSDDGPVGDRKVELDDALERTGYMVRHYNGPHDAEGVPEYRDGWYGYCRRHLRESSYEEACQRFSDAIGGRRQDFIRIETLSGVYYGPSGDDLEAILSETESVIPDFVDLERDLVFHRLYIPVVTTLTPQWSVSVTDLPLIVLPSRFRYMVDLGNIKTYSVTFDRPPPDRPDDMSYDDRNWTNAKWIDYFRDFFDVWQNGTYGENGERTGGYGFHLIPPDPLLVPGISENVFLTGPANIEYGLNIESVTINLLVATMVYGSPVGATLNLRFEYDGDSFTVDAVEGDDFIFPAIPYRWTAKEPDLRFWRTPDGNRWYPGSSVDWYQVSKYFIGGDTVVPDVLRYRCSYLMPAAGLGLDYTRAPLLDGLVRFMADSGPDDMFQFVLVGGGGGAGDEHAQDIGLNDAGIHLVRQPAYPDDFGNVVLKLQNPVVSGGGGGGMVVAVPRLIQGGIGSAMVSLPTVVGGMGGARGSRGGDTSITISGTVYTARGGEPGSYNGAGGSMYSPGGRGGRIQTGGRVWYNSRKDGIVEEEASGIRFGDGAPSMGIPGKGTPYGAGGGAANLNQKVRLWSDGVVGEETELVSRGGMFHPDPPLQFGGKRYNTFAGTNGGGGGSYIFAEKYVGGYGSFTISKDGVLGKGGDGLILINKYTID